jgi:hypothetical protein
MLLLNLLSMGCRNIPCNFSMLSARYLWAFSKASSIERSM